MGLETKDIDQIKGLFGEAVKPITDGLQSVKEEVEGVKAKATELEQKATDLGNKHQEIERKAADGTLFPLGNGGNPMGRKSAAYVRPEALGDRPYSMGRLMLAILERDEKHAPLEVHISEQMKAMGFHSTQQGRAYMVPLSSSEEYIPDSMGQKGEEMRKLLKDAFRLEYYDAQEVHNVMKAYRPDLIGKAMDPLTDTLGGHLIPFPEKGELIELFRNATVFGPAGAQQISLPPGGLDYPTETGGTTFARRRMGVQQDITDSTPTFGTVRLSPKELAGMVKIPNSLIRFSAPSAEAVVRRSLAADAAVAADYDYLVGQGGTTTPLGLLNYPLSANNTPTAGRVTLHNAGTTGATGDTFLPTDVTTMLSLIEEANDREGANAWVMRPRRFYNLANYRADAVSAGDQAGPFLFPVTRGAMSGSIEKTLQGVPVVTSQQVPLRSKGGVNTLTVIIAGNFRRMVIGRVGAIEIQASSEAGFARNETWIRCILYDDSALLKPESFVVCDQLVL